MEEAADAYGRAACEVRARVDGAGPEVATAGVGPSGESGVVGWFVLEGMLFNCCALINNVLICWRG